MANEQNLIPFNKRTESEQREYASRGGKKSGEVRRQKKKMKETINMLLSLNLPDSEGKEQLKQMGIEDEDLNVQTAILMQQVKKAMAGNLDSAKFVRDVSDEIGAIKDDGDQNDRIIIVDDLDDMDDDLDDESS